MINDVNFRSTTGYNTFQGDLILDSVTNQILSSDSNGLVYGISNSIGNFLKDVDGSGTYTFSQITSDDVQFKLNSNIVPVTDSTRTVLTNSNVSTTQVNYLSNVTSDTQTQINSKQNIINSSNLLNVSYVGNGDVTNTVLYYIKNLASDAQTQIN